MTRRVYSARVCVRIAHLRGNIILFVSGDACVLNAVAISKTSLRAQGGFSSLECGHISSCILRNTNSNESSLDLFCRNTVLLESWRYRICRCTSLTSWRNICIQGPGLRLPTYILSHNEKFVCRCSAPLWVWSLAPAQRALPDSSYNCRSDWRQTRKLVKTARHVRPRDVDVSICYRRNIHIFPTNASCIRPHGSIIHRNSPTICSWGCDEYMASGPRPTRNSASHNDTQDMRCRC